MISVDPGGTYGAEVQVTIVGRGRVVSTTPGIDCPSRCFVLNTFENSAAPGASGNIQLKAISTPEVRFKGWTFGTELVGARGRGGENCNPIKRAAQPGSGDPNSDTITLAYGETNGTPPPGQEGACGGGTTVPVAYRVTATFEDIPVPDAEPDANVGDIVFLPPATGAVAKEIGYVSSTYLFWKFDVGGNSGIAYGTRSSGTMPATTPSILVQPTAPITLFEIEPSSTSNTSHNVIWQTAAGIGFVQNGPNLPTTFTGGPATCDAIASYSTSVFCFAAGALYEWTTASPSTPIVRFSGATLPARKFAVDASYFYFIQDNGIQGQASIQRMLRSSADGGATPALQDIITVQSNPNHLELLSSSYLAWLNFDAAGTQAVLLTAFNSGGSTNTSIPPTANLKLLGIEYSSSSSYVWGGVVPADGNNCQILRGFGTSPGTPTTVVQGIKGLQDFTVDSSYIYWTQSDGRVYRRSKTGI